MIAQEAAVSQERLWGQVVAKVWSDEGFKQRLLDDPREVLAEHGIDMPGNGDIRVLEDSAEVRHLVLPRPPVADMIDEELGDSTVAYCYSGYCGRCGCGCRRCGYCE